MAVDCAQLYTQHFTSVYHYVYWRLRDVASTEDVVSDIFLKAVAAADNYHWRPGASEKSWLFAIVRNTLIDHFRKKHLTTVDLDTVEVPDQSNHHHLGDQLDHNQDYAAALRAIDTLPDRQREIIILRYHSELSNKEIAKLLCINPSSVSAALTKAKQQLANVLPKPL